MKVPIYIPVAAITLFLVVMVASLAQLILLYEREVSPHLKEKVSLRRLNELNTIVDQHECGYTVYVDGKFFDSKTY